MIDLNLLRLMRNRNQFRRYYSGLPRRSLDEDVLAVLDGYHRWFEKCPDETEVDISTFLPFFFRSCRPNLRSEQQAQFKAMLLQAAKPIKDSTADAMAEDLMTLELASQLSAMIDKYSEGGEIDLPQEFSMALDSYKMRVRTQGGQWNQTDVTELIAGMQETGGVRWRLKALSSTMRGLRGGNFGIIAARPDVGKTSFLASEGTFLGPQLDMFDPAQNIIWLNNEGTSDAIIPRIYQAALGKTIDELGKMDREDIQEQYRKVMGRGDRCRVYDIHGMTIAQVEKILETSNPGLVFFDMIDNIHGFGDAARTDLALEKMYQRGRELAVKYNFIGLATSQVSAEGDGELYPKMHMLKDSKTGKQGACDFIVMIGASHDSGMETIRGISTPKNKLTLPGQKKSNPVEVQFKPHIARYEDFNEMEIG